MKYKLLYLETCNSQYFSGHHLPVIQVMVDCKTTIKMLKQDLICCDAADPIEDLDEGSYLRAVEEWYENILILGYKDDDIPTIYIDLPDIEQEDYEEYDVYSYFVLETIED